MKVSVAICAHRHPGSLRTAPAVGAGRLLLFLLLLLSGMGLTRPALANPTVMQGGSASFAPTGTTYPAATLWDIVQGTTTVATSSASNGWAVTYAPNTNLFTVSAPTTATVATNYVVRNYLSSGPKSATFDVVSAGPPQLTGVSVAPTTVIGGYTSTGTVTLSSAPTTALTVTLASSVSSVASVPASVNVAAGSTTATFTVTTTAVVASTGVTLTATQGTVSQTATLTVVPAPVLQSLSLVPAGVTGGSNSTGTVKIDSAAPSGGVAVALASTNSAATVPASVTIPQGATQASFTITTVAVASQTTGNISASFNGTTKSQVFNVYPAQLNAETGFVVSPANITGGQNVTATITLDGPAPAAGFPCTLSVSNTAAAALTNGQIPETQTLLPATVTVPAGQSSYSFPIATSTVNYPLQITLTLTKADLSLTANVVLYPANLYLKALVGPNTLRLGWDGYTSGNFILKRDGVTIATPTSSTKTYDDVFTPTYTSGQAYIYDLYDQPPTPQGGTPPAPVLLSTTKIYPYRVVASDNQAVDSRLDQRYSTNVFLDHQFKSTTYKGGLFAGMAPGSDQSKVGRSFARFNVPSQSAAGLTFRLGSVNAYFTGAAGSVNNLQIGCQAIPNTTWDATTLKWTTAPTFTPGAAFNAIPITYNPASPTPGWQAWSLGDAIKAGTLSGQPLSVAWAALDETQAGWAYFAKKEYDANLAPFVGYAYESPRPIRLVWLRRSNNNAFWGVRVIVNGIGPNDSVNVVLDNGWGGAPTVSQTVTVTGLNNIFAITDPGYFFTAAPNPPTCENWVRVRATCNGASAGGIYLIGYGTGCGGSGGGGGGPAGNL